MKTHFQWGKTVGVAICRTRGGKQPYLITDVAAVVDCVACRKHMSPEQLAKTLEQTREDASRRLTAERAEKHPPLNAHHTAVALRRAATVFAQYATYEPTDPADGYGASINAKLLKAARAYAHAVAQRFEHAADDAPERA